MMPEGLHRVLKMMGVSGAGIHRAYWVADPQVRGVYAVRVPGWRGRPHRDLLVYVDALDGRGDAEDVTFSTWPPEVA